MKSSKRVRANNELVDSSKVYSIAEAIELVKKTANTKFNGSVEVHIRTNIEPRKTDQAIRGTVTLPHGTGQTKRIAAFVSEDKQKDATAAGAALIGAEDLIAKIKETGKTDFDIAVAEPKMMPKLAGIAKILGTRGLMPNPKNGTVNENIAAAIKEIAGGRMNFKNDATGIIHAIVGKTNFEAAQILENFESFMKAVHTSKPSAVKKQLIATVTVNATMGPGIRVKA